MIAQLGLGLIFALAVAAAGAGLYLEGKKSGRNEQIAKQAALEEVAQDAAERSAHLAADAISRIRVQNRTIVNEVQREVSERTVYRDCLHSPEQLQRINAAITGVEPPERADRGGMPASDAAR